MCYKWWTLTVGVLEGLFFFGRFWDDLDPLAQEDTDVCAVPVEHLHREHEVLAFVWVWDVQCFGCAIVLQREDNICAFIKQGNHVVLPLYAISPKCVCVTFPSKLSCCISWSLLPMPMKAHGWDSCSEHPSLSICSLFFFHPQPIRYTHGGGQKNLHIQQNKDCECKGWLGFFNFLKLYRKLRIINHFHTNTNRVKHFQPRLIGQTDL